jgi:hypothetical protein
MANNAVQIRLLEHSALALRSITAALGASLYRFYQT